MKISRFRLIIILGISLPIAFFSYRYRSSVVISDSNPTATAIKEAVTFDPRAMKPAGSNQNDDLRIISDTLTSTGRVVIAEKDGVQKQVIVPLTLSLSKEQMFDGLFSDDIQLVRKPAKISLNKHLRFYGVTLDEQTNSLAEVHIKGKVLIVDEQNQRQWIPMETTSDAEGRFEFNQDGGQLIMINVSKGTNYIAPPPQWFEYGSVRYGPLENEFISRPDLLHPKVFVLIKKQVAEPLFEVDRGWTAPHTGEPVRIDLTTGQMVSTGGDLIVSIWCPEPYVEGEHIPWKLSVQVVDGGLLPVESDRLEYMLSAPESGYSEGFVIEYDKATEPWRAQHRGFYYLTSRNGQIYAKMNFDMHVRWDQRGVPFGLRAFVNTNGSRNLQNISQ